MEKYLCEQMTGCQGAGDFCEWAEQQGYPFCEVVDWTSSAGNWLFIISRDGVVWHLMFQENAYPKRGFNRHIDLDRSLEGTAEEALEYLSAMYS